MLPTPHQPFWPYLGECLDTFSGYCFRTLMTFLGAVYLGSAYWISFTQMFIYAVLWGAFWSFGWRWLFGKKAFG